jgi:hypothetical protein
MLIFLHLRFEAAYFILDDSFLLIFSNFINSGLISFNSLLNIRDLILIRSNLGDLFIDDLSDVNVFFLILLLGLFVFTFLVLVNVGVVLSLEVHVDNISGFNTLIDVVQSLISGRVGIILRSLNSIVDLLDLVSFFRDFALGLHFLLSFFLYRFLDGGNLTSDRCQFVLVGFNLRAFG